MQKIGLREILKIESDIDIRYADRKISEFKKRLDEDKKGPRTENNNAAKMLKCFLYICWKNDEKQKKDHYGNLTSCQNFKWKYQSDDVVLDDWHSVIRNLTSYMGYLTEKISLSSHWYSYPYWYVTGQGQQVPVEHLLMQLKQLSEASFVL